MTSRWRTLVVSGCCLLASCGSPKLKRINQAFYLDEVPVGKPSPHLYWVTDDSRKVVDREILSYSDGGCLVYEAPWAPSSRVVFAVSAGKIPVVVGAADSLRPWHLDVDGLRRFNVPRIDLDGRTLLDMEYVERRFMCDEAWQQPAFKDDWKTPSPPKGDDVVARFSRTISLDVNGADEVHNSTLSQEVAAVHLGVVEELLRAGAEVNTANDGGITPLMIAAAYLPDNLAIFQRLLDAGGDINAQDRRGMTVLMTAASNGRKNAVKLLLAHGADPAIHDNLGRTALTLSSVRDPEIARVLTAALETK